MKHVWMVNHYAAVPGEAGLRHHSLAKAIQSTGWSSTIIGNSVQHNSGKQRLRGPRLRRREVIDGVEILWVRSNRYDSNGVLRVLNMTVFALALLFPGMTRGLRPPDVVLGSSVHPLAAWAASVLARRRGVPFVFEIRDLWPETLVELGNLERSSLAAKALYWLEAYLCERAERIVTSMPFAHEYLATRGIPEEKVVWISNGVWPEEFAASARARDLDTVTTFLYFGAVGTANALDVLVRGFARARFSSPARFVIMGEGPRLHAIRDLVAELGISNCVEVPGYVARSDIPRRAAEADILVAALIDSPLYKYGISLNKLFEYMAASKPILFAGTARGNPVESSGGGLVVAPRVDTVAAAFESLAAMDAQRRASLGRANRESVVNNFAFPVLGERLGKVLNCAVSATESTRAEERL